MMDTIRNYPNIAIDNVLQSLAIIEIKNVHGTFYDYVKIAPFMASLSEFS